MRKYYFDIIGPLVIGLLAIAATILLVPYTADAQTVGTYTEQGGAVKNQIGIVVSTDTVTTAMSAKLPATLGPKTSATSLSVVQASDAAILATYTIATTAYAAYATPTDMLCVTGSATRVVRIFSMTLQGSATTSTKFTISYVKRSTANTGGTSSPLTPVALDSANAAPTAANALYSAAPTTGNALGFVNMTDVLFTTSTQVPGAASTTGTSTLSDDLRQPVVLRGVAESLCVNFAGAAWPAGGVATILATWTESIT